MILCGVALKNKKIQGNLPVPLFLLLILLLGFVLLGFVPIKHAIVIENYRTGELLRVLPLGKGESFAIRYKHSVNLSHVTDTLEWTGDRLMLRTSLFTSFGAGIPVPADGIGTDITNTEDGFLLSGIDTPQKDNALLIMLQTVPEHCILYRDQEVSLLAMAGSGALLRLCVKPVSIYALIFYS